jgi:hypothetical protein
MAEHVDLATAISQLRTATRHLNAAALSLNEVEDGRRLPGFLTFLVGGLTQTVENLADQLESTACAASYTELGSAEK